MALFGNQNKKSIEELENYYSGKQERTGMAWMMAFLSLILTITVLGGLFLGGRWAYRTFIDDTSNDIAISDVTDETTTGVPGSSSDAPATTTPPPPANGGVVSDNAARTESPSPQPSPAPAPQPSPSPTPSATAGVQTPRTGDLPNTGSSIWVAVALASVTFISSYTVFARLQLARARSR